MTRWFRRIIPCIRDRQPSTNTSTSSREHTELPNTNKTDGNNTEQSKMELVSEITEKNSEIEIFSEKFEHVPVKMLSINTIGKDDTKISDCNPDKNQGDTKTQLIACTLHESLNDSVQGKVTHANVQTQPPAVSKNEKPQNTLVFKTIMVDGEPSTKRYKTVEPKVGKEIFPGEGDSKLCEEIQDSEIKIVFSYEVLEYLTKCFRPNNDSALSGDQTMANDLIICTLFPKQLNLSDEIDNNIQTDLDNNYEMNQNDDINSEMSDNMEVDDSNSNSTEISIPITPPSAYIFNKNTSSAQRSEYILTNSGVKGFQTSMSKSSPHMQQQENNINHNRDAPRLRRNISKKVSWKENVEVCFINQSSRSANEILQEIQPLIDHEIYWKECVCERDRKRREKWLKIRADEQRCLTGDGQFHDYFAYRTHHFDDDEFRLIE